MFLNVMVNQVQLQEEVQRGSEKGSFLSSQSLESGGTAHHMVTEEVPGFGQEAEGRSRGKSRSEALLGFPLERQGRVNISGLAGGWS